MWRFRETKRAGGFFQVNTGEKCLTPGLERESDNVNVVTCKFLSLADCKLS